MKKFTSAETANDYIIRRVDSVVKNRTVHLKKGITLSMSVTRLADNTFTNTYDVQYDPTKVALRIGLNNERTSLYDVLRSDNHLLVASSGGFSYLTDDPNIQPRHLSLNLAIQDGDVMSLPVIDREALLIINGQMSARFLRATGTMEINGENVTWSGSLTDHPADIKVYGNGNSVISHASDESGSRRVLDESSRFTPHISNGQVIDVGFIRQKGSTFISAATSSTGMLDIFAFDIVLRCPKRIAADYIKMKVESMDSLPINTTIQSAMSAGPLLTTANFESHLINRDASLGTNAPFANQRAARMIIYETKNGMRHLRLLDGRPGSHIFPGVTPYEAVHIINSDAEVVWGCFLDGGQTSKLCVRKRWAVNSFGNRHYINKVPEKQNIVWVPKTGRSLASIITLN